MTDKGMALPPSEDRAGGLRPEPAAQSQPKALIPSAWISIAEHGPPLPEVFVLCWDGRETFVEWFGSLPDAGRGVTHWIPYELPPGATSEMHDGRRAIAEPILDTVKVTAADFNGRDWDGSPFSAVPPWLRAALEDGRVKPDTPNCTDYAEWWVQTPGGVLLAGPGDLIGHYCGVLTVCPANAQAIEARRAETGTGSVHESAVAESDAP